MGDSRRTFVCPSPPAESGLAVIGGAIDIGAETLRLDLSGPVLAGFVEGGTIEAIGPDGSIWQNNAASTLAGSSITVPIAYVGDGFPPYLVTSSLVADVGLRSAAGAPVAPWSGVSITSE